MQIPEPNSGSSALVEELFFLAAAPDDRVVDPIHLVAQVDLTEFQFTDAELDKLRRLARKLEFALSDEFNHHWEAASVIVEIRTVPRST